MRKWVAIVCLIFCFAVSLVSQETLTIGDILYLVELGCSDDEIVAEMERSQSKFALSEREAESLWKQGVSERLLFAMGYKAKKQPPSSPKPGTLAFHRWHFTLPKGWVYERREKGLVLYPKGVSPEQTKVMILMLEPARLEGKKLQEWAKAKLDELAAKETVMTREGPKPCPFISGNPVVIAQQAVMSLKGILCHVLVATYVEGEAQCLVSLSPPDTYNQAGAVIDNIFKTLAIGDPPVGILATEDLKPPDISDLGESPAEYKFAFAQFSYPSTWYYLCDRDLRLNERYFIAPYPLSRPIEDTHTAEPGDTIHADGEKQQWTKKAVPFEVRSTEDGALWIVLKYGYRDDIHSLEIKQKDGKEILVIDGYEED